MSVIVVTGTVDTGERVYLTGETIEGLSEADENELVDQGVCKFASGSLPEDEIPSDKKSRGKKKDSEGTKNKADENDDGPNTGLPGIDA